MDRKLAFVPWGVAILAALSTIGIWQHAAQLKAENQRLTARTSELEKSLEEKRSESTSTGLTLNTDAQSRKSELLKLRNDVTQLRGIEKEAAQAGEENQRLKMQNETLQTELTQARREIVTLRTSPPPPLTQPRYQPANAQNSPSDPLAFYRKNPELMRRYFPHLVQEENPAANPPPAPAAQPPQ